MKLYDIREPMFYSAQDLAAHDEATTDPEKLYEIARKHEVHMRPPNHIRAFDYYRQAAEMGDVCAQLQLGNIYAKDVQTCWGDGWDFIQHDDCEAVAWYQTDLPPASRRNYALTIGFCYTNSQCRESGACLRGEFVGFGLEREGKADGVEDFGLLIVGARQMRVTLSVAVGGVEIGQTSKRHQGVVRSDGCGVVFGTAEGPVQSRFKPPRDL